LTRNRKKVRIRLSTSLQIMNIKSALLTLAATLALSSCNTISGIGKDVEAMGSKIDSSSQATSKSMQ
jgi:hypothetical protein